jgi:A/G-specific adenine glycosylase
MVCTRSKPKCEACPLGDICVARATNRVGELPQPKPRKEIPERAATLLVVLDEQGRVLLETRPPAGIWGGLQSLPELPPALDPTLWAQNRLACRVTAVSPAPTFLHVFSHFRLHITPLLLQVEGVAVAMEPGFHWLEADALAQAALPAPVRTLLAQLFGSSSLLSRKR